MAKKNIKKKGGASHKKEMSIGDKAAKQGMGMDPNSSKEKDGGTPFTTIIMGIALAVATALMLIMR